MDWALHVSRIIARLGEDMIYTAPGGGTPTTVRGIFRRPYDATLGVGSSNPSVACMSADVPGIATGASFTIAGTGYKVVESKPDRGAGFTIAELALA